MTTPSNTGKSPNPQNVFETLTAYQRSAALKAGIELNLFTEIGRGHRTVDAIATAVKASVRGVRILCDYLTILGFLLKDKNEYMLSVDAATFLNQDSPAYFGSTVNFLLDPRLIAPYTNLAEVVRNGTTTMPGEGSVSPDNPIWVEFAKHMAPMLYPAAVEMAALVAGEGEMKVLDIAAGHGLFGIKIAEQNPKARITALDWPGVLAVATANAEKFGVAARHSALPGDAFDVAFPEQYDMVLVTNFFHHFDPPTCEKLMRKILAALAPNGRCVTLDFVPNDDRVSPQRAATFAMMMLGTTAAGDAYTFAEYDKMFRNAGFGSQEIYSLNKAPQSVMVSRRA